MSLSARHRSTIYTKFERILGSEETEALLDQFPARDAEEPITRDHLDMRIAELRVDLSTELHNQGDRLTTELHRQTVWLLGINVTTMLAAVGLARLVS